MTDSLQTTFKVLAIRINGIISYFRFCLIDTTMSQLTCCLRDAAQLAARWQMQPCYKLALADCTRL